MFRIAKKFSRLFNKHQKHMIVLLFFMMLIGAFLEVLGVSMMVPLVSAIMDEDIITKNEIVAYVCNLFGIGSQKEFVLVCVVALIFVFIAKDLYLILEYYAQNRFVFNNRYYTANRLMSNFINRPYEYFLNASTADIIRVIQTDTSSTFSLLVLMLQFSTEMIVAVTLIITIFVVSPWMTITIAATMLITMAIIAKVVKPVLHKEGMTFQEYSAATAKWLLQSVTGIKEVKITNKEQYFQDNYQGNGLKTIRAERKKAVLDSMPRLLIEMVSTTTIFAIIAVMIIRGIEITSLIPTLSAFGVAAVKLLPSANRISGAINSVAFTEPALDELLEYIDVIENPYGKKELDSNKVQKISLRDKIELAKVTYSYPNTDRNVLDEAEMIIPAGKSIGVVGASGAGKTTAIDVLLGLLEPSSGAILADGQNVMDNYAGWLSNIGYIPQMIFMLDDSIKENILFGNEYDEEALWKALEKAQLADFVRSLPDGVETQIGERGVRISGGQRQRLGVARALYTDPDILVFDEATSALDNDTEAAIMESINSLHGEKTMIIIAHRLTTIEECDMVYRVENGKIARER